MLKYDFKNILIVDDHPLNIDAYKNLVKLNMKEIPLNLNSSTTCEEAVKFLQNFKKEDLQIHYAFIDYNLPEFYEKNILNGIDLSLYIRSLFPKCKIIFITMHNEAAIIGNIIKAVNPQGLISKSDVNFESFKKIIQTIFINNDFYKSKSIIEAENILFKNNLDWDEYDYKILELISKGENTNAIPKYIPLTLSSIEKRKSKIKKHLLLQKGNDRDLIFEARKKGLL